MPHPLSILRTALVVSFLSVSTAAFADGILDANTATVETRRQQLAIDDHEQITGNTADHVIFRIQQDSLVNSRVSHLW